MRIWKSPFVDLGVETGAYAAGDALGSKGSFSGVPEHGYVVGIVVQDRDKEYPVFDLVLFDNNDIGGTTDNAALDPTDAELAYATGAVRVSDYFAFNDNALGTVSGVRLPFWAREGSLYFQCVIRAAHTFTAITDLQVAIYVEVP